MKSHMCPVGDNSERLPPHSAAGGTRPRTSGGLQRYQEEMSSWYGIVWLQDASEVLIDSAVSLRCLEGV